MYKSGPDCLGLRAECRRFETRFHERSAVYTELVNVKSNEVQTTEEVQQIVRTRRKGRVGWIRFCLLILPWFRIKRPIPKWTWCGFEIGR
ncbi:hypothetical protein AVEN_42806-1 [Araneus ventricosus]|uniref:Uncharacterized protein n=1 Tax=Araneus ventricosus TaxID=182803 RepID=A0A4Y2AG85_ARAVE|nr:hypothetical protein AVEN_42806-1 [Araneus ventricosus]